MAAQLLGDRTHFARRDALHIHFGQHLLAAPVTPEHLRANSPGPGGTHSSSVPTRVVSSDHNSRCDTPTRSPCSRPCPAQCLVISASSTSCSVVFDTARSASSPWKSTSIARVLSSLSPWSDGSWSLLHGWFLASEPNHLT